MMKHYEVVAAVIEHDGKILCMQRNKGKFDYVLFSKECTDNLTTIDKNVIKYQ